MWIPPPFTHLYTREIIVLSAVYNFLQVFLHNRKLSLFCSYMGPYILLTKTKVVYFTDTQKRFWRAAWSPSPSLGISFSSDFFVLFSFSHFWHVSSGLCGSQTWLILHLFPACSFLPLVSLYWHHLPQLLCSPPTGSTHTCYEAPKFFVNTTQNLRKKYTAHLLQYSVSTSNFSSIQTIRYM